MRILVINCNHWIGYHVVNELLEKSCKVDGIGNSELEEDLLMFFGRNSDFSLITNEEGKQYDVCIVIGDYDQKEKIASRKMICLGSNDIGEIDSNGYIIPVDFPLLFGEWMPMCEKGCYFDGKFFSFKSDFFHKNALYIKEFTKWLVDYMNSSDVPVKLKVKPSYSENKTGVILDNIVYIYDNVPIEERIDHVMKHYHMFQSFYENLYG